MGKMMSKITDQMKSYFKGVSLQKLQKNCKKRFNADVFNIDINTTMYCM